MYGKVLKLNILRMIKSEWICTVVNNFEPYQTKFLNIGYDNHVDPNQLV